MKTSRDDGNDFWTVVRAPNCHRFRIPLLIFSRDTNQPLIYILIQLYTALDDRKRR